MQQAKKARQKPRGKPFQPGHHIGRPKGARSRAKLIAEAAARAIVDDPYYRKKLLSKAKAGKLAPAVEVMLHYYAYGKPIEIHQHSGPGGGPIETRATVHVYLPDNGRKPNNE